MELHDSFSSQLSIESTVASVCAGDVSYREAKSWFLECSTVYDPLLKCVYLNALCSPLSDLYKASIFLVSCNPARSNSNHPNAFLFDAQKHILKFLIVCPSLWGSGQLISCGCTVT